SVLVRNNGWSWSWAMAAKVTGRGQAHAGRARHGAATDLRRMFDGARILVAPLDWGLGHAARCVPVIGALLEAGAVPVIGADKAPLALLRDAFPKLEHARLPGLEVRYAGGGPMAWAMARQLPALLRQPGRGTLLLRRVRKRQCRTPATRAPRI